MARTTSDIVPWEKSFEHCPHIRVRYLRTDMWLCISINSLFLRCHRCCSIASEARWTESEDRHKNSWRTHTGIILRLGIAQLGFPLSRSSLRPRPVGHESFFFVSCHPEFLLYPPLVSFKRIQPEVNKLAWKDVELRMLISVVAIILAIGCRAFPYNPLSCQGEIPTPTCDQLLGGGEGPGPVLPTSNPCNSLEFPF